ncbi:MAG: metal ABC transporter substrate-binding protein [Beijerinckiaceae bacterium]
MLARRTLLLAGIALTLHAAPALAQEAIPIVASFSIVGDLVKQVGGTRVAVTTLVGPNGDAHVYAPSPADGKTLAGAKVVFTNGMRFENWMEKLAKASGTKAVMVEVSKGIHPLMLQGDKGHDGHKDKHGHDHRGQADPHAWQSIINAKIYVTNIRDALIAADAAGKATYEANAQSYLAQLEQLDGEIRAAMDRVPVANRKLITAHDAFGYFARDYKITFVAPKGVSTDAEATAKDVARIIRQVKAEKITAVFLENVQDKRLAEQISRETGARIGGTLFSDALSAAGGPAPTYIDMMRHNAQQIAKALAPTS